MPINPLVKGLMDEFFEQTGFKRSKESADFELFATNCVVGKNLKDQSVLEELMAGDETVGIDAVAIAVNGAHLIDRTDLDEFGDSQNLGVTFSFVQAKTSPKIDCSDLLGFGNAVRQFFDSDSGRLKESPFIASQRDLKDSIYEQGSRLRPSLPSVELYYATSGNADPEDENIIGVTNQIKEDLERLSLFDSVNIKTLGANEIHRLSVSTRNSIKSKVQLQRKISLPRIEGIEDAYLGVIPVEEYLKLIVDENDELRDYLFYDNVRGFQDMNPVNAKIEETLSGTSADLFPVLNNGVTIVAEEIHTAGDEITLTDFQIVNGCQTSHIIYRCRKEVSNPKTLVPIRLIRTESDLVRDQVIKATNSQTLVKEDDLLALTDFQKKLEDFYRTGAFSDRALYYERRSGQYRTENAKQIQIITPTVQMRAFAAMYLQEPHSATAYFNALFGRTTDEIFHPDHKYLPYFASALAWERLEYAWRSNNFDKALKPGRYQILLTARFLAAKSDQLPVAKKSQLNSIQAEKEARGLIDQLNNADKAFNLFDQAKDVVLQASDGPLTRDRAKRKPSTDGLLTTLNELSAD